MRLSCVVIAALVLASGSALAEAPAAVTIASGWQMQDAAKITADGAAVSAADFDSKGWYAATVPGTVLTTLVNNHVYPEPLYGENNRPEVIPDSLARTPFWYRATFTVPRAYKGRHVWLNFDGINFAAAVWVNGTQVGAIKGAFIRGRFDITQQVKPGRAAVLAVLITPQPHPGIPHEHTVRAGNGKNGGESAMDGPTFLCTMGWDWIPAIRDRDTGIWQKVFLSATGPVAIRDPQVTTDLPLPRTDSADVTVQTTLENASDAPVTGVLKGSFGSVTFAQTVTVPAHGTEHIKLDPQTTPAMHLDHPLLWWPNGYGPQNLYKLYLSFDIAKKTSDADDVTFGVRKITYSVPESENLTISVNGVPVFIRGGNWGLDEAMKRIPRERLENDIRMHAEAHLNLIRNWVGQSTSEDFYELCDQYGILVWDEFFQPNPGDGPNPDDLDTYLANVRDKVLRFRNHASIMLWCARNEGPPPPEIDAALRKLLPELDPDRLYQPSSTDGRGVGSHGPYRWREPRKFYKIDVPFKTETGILSVPTIESIQGMMPEKDWNSFNDDWAEHDFNKSNGGGNEYPQIIAKRYGAFRNLADFVRKAQLADYESFRALYEGRNAALFKPATAVITWMSNPAQPSFVWQMYSYDLEPFSSFFAVEHANELVHVQLDQSNGHIEVVDSKQAPVQGVVHATVYNLDGSVAGQQELKVSAAPLAATDLGALDVPAKADPVHFLLLQLESPTGEVLSRNFYWDAAGPNVDDFTSLASMPGVTLEAKATRSDAAGRTKIVVTLHNPTAHLALMTHLQLHRKDGERVLPVIYSDNYVSLPSGATQTVTIDAATTDVRGDAVVAVDGFNVSVAPSSGKGISVAANENAQPEHSAATGMAWQTVGLR